MRSVCRVGRETRLKPRSDCQPKSEIRSYLDSMNGSELHEIRFVQIHLELHSYVFWNPIKIAILEIRFVLTSQIGFSIAFSCPHATGLNVALEPLL